jgi:hypothetical protein
MRNESMNDLRQYAGLCAELEKQLAQALAVSFCVRNGQAGGPLKRSAFELNKSLSTGIDLLVEISTHLNAEDVL